MNSKHFDPSRKLKEINPHYSFCIGIDSDGTVFNTMEFKHRDCFIPVTIQHWGLQPIARFVCEVIVYVNLTSRWRGVNRWPTMIKIIDLLSSHPGVRDKGFILPCSKTVQDFVKSGFQLSNEGLIHYIDHNPDPQLSKWLDWSKTLDQEMKLRVKQARVFYLARLCLQEMVNFADLFLFTGSREEIVFREWKESGIYPLVRGAAGQETGTKTQAISWTMQGKYQHKKTLMIGDTLGDLEAAQTNDILFFPIFPGQENESWQYFRVEGMERFVNQTYEGAFEQGLVSKFKNFFEGELPWLMG